MLTTALLLTVTACTDTADTEIVTADAVVTEPLAGASSPADYKSETAPQASKEETTETDITYALTGTPHPQIMYNGELYVASIYSNQLEVDGEFYEFTGEKAFVDAEKIKKECEYLGVSIPAANDDAREAPTKELETTGSYGETWELYKIDENQILMLNTEKRNITNEIFPKAAYFGEVNDYWIALKTGLSDEIYEDLTKKYYRLNEYAEETAKPSETTHETISETTPETITETSAHTSVSGSATNETIPEITKATLTAPETAVTISKTTAVTVEEANSTKTAADIPAPISWKNLTSNNGIEVEITVLRPSPSSEPTSVGYLPLIFNDDEYRCAYQQGYYTADEKKCFYNLEAYSNDWKLDPEQKLDAAMMNFDELEYVGNVTKLDLGYDIIDEAYVYQYEDNLIFIYNQDSFLLYKWDIRTNFFDFDNNENARIGNDLEKLKEVLAEHSIDYDPSMFICALMYEKM